MENTVERSTWGGRFEFILSLIGYAVGVGNLWRFPYLCMRNGGGAFLIPYFSSLALCGMPLFLMELCLGQFASRSPTELWNICPLFKGLGWGMVFVSGFVCIYYNIIITWVLFYLFKSFTRELPWTSCDNKWNTEHCFSGSYKNLSYAFSGNETLTNGSLVSRAVSHSVSPAEEFWEREALDMSSGIEDLGGIKPDLCIFLVISWLLIFVCLFKGVESSGKVVYFTALAPYVFLIILFVRGITLPGAMNGIKYYIVPDFSQLLEFRVWTEANLQIFYSLGPAWGGIITMASYNKFNNNCYRDSIIVPIVNCGTSFFGGFVIFSVIGFMAHEAGLPVESVVKSGPGLAFIAYPEAISKMPISPFWAICFFIMLLTLGLDSQFGMFETLLSGIIDSFPRLNRYKLWITAGLCALELILGLPLVTRGGMYVFQLFDWYVGSFSVITISFIECIVVMWIYGHDRFFYDIQCMIGYKPCIWWKICLCGISPCILLIITIYNLVALGEPYYGSYTYPSWAIGIGWTITVFSLVPIPVCMCLALLREEGTFLERLRKTLKPNEHWGPAKKEDRLNYKYNMDKDYEISLKPLNEILPIEKNGALPQV